MKYFNGNYTIPNNKAFKKQAINWLKKFEVHAFHDSCGYHSPYSSYDFIIAAGAQATLQANAGKAFSRLKDFQHGHWAFGYLGYDLKNEVEKHLTSNNEASIAAPDLFFFIPSHVIIGKGNEIRIITVNDKPSGIFKEISAGSPDVENISGGKFSGFKHKMEKDYYLECVEQVKNHIIEGDVYELNFCQEFHAEEVEIDPYHTFSLLQDNAPNPFAAFLKIPSGFVISGSMERFLGKEGNTLLSQPIKGTIARGSQPGEDESLKELLRNNEKERAENIMIVDLVRNDLSKSCKPGTVKVEELCGIYSFPSVHQMISTITAELKDDVHYTDAIKNAFPMGSMTGAPKIMAMELIEQYELSRRGIYSGAIGYFSPDGNFDFSVVIRTLIYDHANRKISAHTGSAITYDSKAESEYRECLLKLQNILKVLKP